MWIFEKIFLKSKMKDILLRKEFQMPFLFDHTYLYYFWDIWGFFTLRRTTNSTILFLLDSGHSGCGGPGFLNRHTGEITSHNHFNNHNHYHRNSNCHWRIRANAGHVVRLSSIHFDVEPDAKYFCFIYLYIYFLPMCTSIPSANP